jgi:hypothetical protein
MLVHNRGVKRVYYMYFQKRLTSADVYKLRIPVP